MPPSPNTATPPALDRAPIRPTLTRALRLVWLLSLAAVIVGSLLPAQNPVIGLLDQAHVNDKELHFAAYAFLAALPSLKNFHCRRTATTMLCLCLIGGALEIGQLFSPGRSCDWRDFLGDSGGVLTGFALVRILQWTHLQSTLR